MNANKIQSDKAYSIRAKKRNSGAHIFYSVALGVGVQLAETNILQKPVTQRIASNHTNSMAKMITHRL